MYRVFIKFGNQEETVLVSANSHEHAYALVEVMHPDAHILGSDYV